MKFYFDDVSFDGQLQRAVAKAPYGCVDLGEVFAIATRAVILPSCRLRRGFAVRKEHGYIHPDG